MKVIVHVDKKWGIGKNNSLMFRLPADMKFFRETTTGKTIVMGGNTLRSFPENKPLKNRTNVVITHSIKSRDDCVVVHDGSQLFKKIKSYKGKEVYVIGGASIYKMLLPYCEEALVTKVDADGGADTFFPDLDADKNFTLVSASDEVETNGYKIKFCTYKNNAVKSLP